MQEQCQRENDFEIVSAHSARQRLAAMLQHSWLQLPTTRLVCIVFRYDCREVESLWSGRDHLRDINRRVVLI